MRHFLLPANLLAAIVIAGLIAIQAFTDRNRILADARADTMNLRAALVEHTRQTLAGLHLALDSIAEAIDPEALDGDATYRALSARQDVLVPTFAVFVLDAQGRLVATSRTRHPEPVDLSRDPAFTAHRDAPGLGVYVAPPRRGSVGHAEDRWIVVVSERLNRADGRFAGIVAAAVSVEYLVQFYEAFQMGAEGVVGMMHQDGALIARSPFDDAYVGASLTDSRLYRELLPAADEGVYRDHLVIDGIERIVAYSRVPGFPVVVYTGISVSERLAGWWQRTLFDGVIAAVIIAILATFSLFALFRLRERDREQDARVAQLTKLSEVSTALFESPDVGTALQRATDLARELVPCHQAVTSVTEGPTLAQSIHAVSLSGKYAAWRDYDDKPDGSGIYRRVCETNRPMRLTQAELEAHPDWTGFGAAKDRHPPMRGWLAVPLMTQGGENFGLIQLSDRKSGEFTSEDQALMVEVARVTGAAVQRLRLADELRDAAAASERLRVEAESARRAESLARTAIEKVLTSIRDAVFAVDRDWRFVYLNHHAEVMLERTADELIGRNVWDEFPEAVGSEAYVQYHRARDENVDVDFRFYYPPLSRWFDVRAFPQEAGGLTVYFQDVSQWVAQEEQLRQAQKMDAVGQLTGGVAHDFNNLLTVILGGAAAVRDGLQEGDPHYGFVSMICSAAERAADLTQRLLAFSRRQPLEPKPVDVNALLQRLEPLLRRTLGEQYDIEFACGTDVPAALVDPGQLESAIVNLAINARDAMPEGGRLTIETAAVEIDETYAQQNIDVAPGSYVRIGIGDDGVGMSPEVRSRAFEPFFTTKKDGEGTGLGLPMVFGFVKQSNGHVSLYSEPGEGTVVKLYLPCAGSGAVPRGQPEPVDAAGGTERILVVEDEDLVRDFTSSSLLALGYDVTAVANGPAARKLLETDRSFDLLLCDVILGSGMDGRQVAEAAQAAIPRLKVLFMSGYTENVIFHNGRLDAGVRLLQKPFRRADLARKVREVLESGI